MRGWDEDLDVLVSDPDKDVRKQVVNAGREQDLDKLVSDPDKDIRIAVVHEARTFGGVGAKKNNLNFPLTKVGLYLENSIV
ncbi:hypothetical protein HRD63_07405 [Lactobacillus delbrueckii subsp. bulgaricus]|uniref:HEAT repeat domain-containing protein n=1 Tax=Lactobacillus delbrueckii TaxID=1584 RepID=UPI00155E657E|nr:HEAT repeat domain-containing protein [Lactobacillus delbrueckii]NRD07016.1 hypothetical protein [Lactobacillus delbrueckii subsp. bulgaricus]